MDAAEKYLQSEAEAKDDFALICLLAQRDTIAFDVLYERYNRIVFTFVLRMANDAMLSEDLTQAVFLKLWTHHFLFKGGNLAAWLCRLARNKCLDVMRSAPSSREELMQLPDFGDTFNLADEIASNFEAARIRAALALLPSDMRSAIELGFLGGLSYPEIARLMSTPLGTIKSRIQKGLRRLRVLLEPGAILT